MKKQWNESADSTADFVILWLKEMEKRELRYVYLRNYEHLPKEVGNDVDLLIEQGKIDKWIELAPETASQFGWRFLRVVPFGCTSLFFFRADRNSVVHVDLNERLEWHFVPMADEKTILSQRQWNGIVFVPSISDELYLNVTTRLVYQGSVREKHRDQWRQMRLSCSDRELEASFSELGSTTLSRRIIHAADIGNWVEVESLHKSVRCHLLRQSVFHAPRRLFASTCHFINRSIGRILAPPGFVFLIQIDVNAEDIAMSALQMAAPRLAEWGNLSECWIDGKVSGGGMHRWMFRAKNGVVCSLAPKCKGRVSTHSLLVSIPAVNHVETPEELSCRIIQKTRDAVIAAYGRIY